MKTPRAFQSRRGFTLIELLVAMTITTIIVGVLVSITSIAIDTWNRSRSELRAARQAKTMVDSMVRDFEALVVRKGNVNEWLSARSDIPGNSTNASDLIFFTAATDRYNGDIGGQNDKGGDVSCVAYSLYYKDPIRGGTAANQTFVLNRHLVNPDLTFNNLLGKTDKADNNKTLSKVFQQYDGDLEDEKSFVCENVFQFTVKFHVQVTDSAATPQVFSVPVSLGDTTKSFQIHGTGITTDYKGASDALVPSGRLTAVEISLTVLSDAGVNLLRKSPGKANDAAWLAKNSFQYSKLIQLPGM